MSEPAPAWRREPQKVAVLRANALGDFVFALPALSALRARFPAAEITLLGKPWHVNFLRGRPSPVDRVVPLPPIAGVGAEEDFQTDPAEYEACVAPLRAERFDLAVQIHGGGRHSNRFLQAIEPQFSIGLRTPDAAPLDRWVSYQYWQPEILRMLEVVALVGATPVTLVPQLAVTDGDREEARRVVPGPRERLVALHMGATDPRRRWPWEHFRRLAETLRGRGFELVCVGGAEDAAPARDLAAAVDNGARSVAGELSLGGLVGLLAECRLVVANDSGPLHVAEAVGTPTVGIYWCGNIVNADPITRHRHRPVLSWRLRCPVCDAAILDRRCEHEVSFADLAPVEEVTAQALDLLGTGSESGVERRNGMA